MEKRIKRFLSLVLALVLVLGMMPAGAAMADENTNLSYRWNMVYDENGNQMLQSVESGSFYTMNTLEWQESSYTTWTDGVINNYSYKMTTPVSLAVDEAWVIEWKASTRNDEGDWRGMLLSNTKTAATKDNECVFSNSTNLAAAYYTSSWQRCWYDSSKIADSNMHVYQLKNEYDADTDDWYVWLYIDGEKHAPDSTSGIKNNATAVLANGGETIDYQYIGCEVKSAGSGWGIQNLNLEYMEIHVNGDCEHSFSEWSNTCTGYTRTCSICGDVETGVHSYRWEKNEDGTALKSVSAGGIYTQNTLTKSGTSNITYKFANSVTLNNSEPWVITFKASGDSDWHSMLLSKNSTPQSAGNQYLFVNKATFAVGYCDDTPAYQNTIFTGVAATIRDGSVHVCRLVNNVETGKIEAYVDGTKLAEADATALDDTMEFNYIGAGSKWGVQDFDLEYMEIAVHGEGEHSYGAWTDVCDSYERVCSACGKVESKAKVSHRWEMNGNGTGLESVTTDGNVENTLTLQTGSVENGVLTSVRYAMAKPVELVHNKEWIIEFEASGNWTGMLLSTYSTSTTANNQYFFRTAAGKLSLGYYKGSSAQNYFMSPTIDTEKNTVYRLENEVTLDDDGNYVSNMVYLWINGEKYGPVNDGTASNYVSGTDLTFNYIGSGGSQVLKNLKLNYLEILVDGETDHAWGDWTDENSDGQMEHTCADCGETETAVAGVVGTDGTVNDYYVDVADAVADANALSGSTVKLVGEVTTDEALTLSCSLDLNGYSLTAASVTALVSSEVYDSVGTGLLVVAQDKLAILNADNPAVPVWNGTAYVLANLEKINTKEVIDYNNNTAVFYFQPVISSNAHEALKLGNATSGVKLCVTVSWTVDDTAGSKTFYCSDALVNSFLDGYNSETGTFKYAFKLSLTGVDKVDDDSLSFSSKVVFQDWSTNAE